MTKIAYKAMPANRTATPINERRSEVMVMPHAESTKPVDTTRKTQKERGKRFPYLVFMK